MDLYSDLPPAQDDHDNNNIVGWIRSTPKSVTDVKMPSVVEPPLKPKVMKPKLPDNSAALKTSKVETIAEVKEDLKSNSINKPLKKNNLSAALAFKPRQAAIQPPVPTVQNPIKIQSSQQKPVEISNSQISQNNQNQTDIEKDTSSQTIFNNNDNFDVPDPYDPVCPNDYIAWCEERLEKKRLAKLMEENKQRLEEMERARMNLEKEREEAAKAGDIARLQASLLSQSSGSAMGRGRGRGVLNLPAWMTAANDAAASENADKDLNHRNEQVGIKRKVGLLSKPSCVVLLKNMVAEEDVDDALANETKNECIKYGSVVKCTVFVVKSSDSRRVPPEERVRTFVQFENQGSAVKAFRDLNGRYFGGRQISASFFEDEKFKSNQLEPSNDEW